jgi:hypothetical protein
MGAFGKTGKDIKKNLVLQTVTSPWSQTLPTKQVLFRYVNKIK